MEDRIVSLFNFVPSFAQGSDILLVHNDTLSLGYLSSLLRQCSFKVTATNQASAAIDMVCEQEGRFKLVMAKANMPDMSTLSFLNILLQKDTTVIFVSSGQNDGVARAALEKGLCYLLEEPIQPEDLISVWQQVYYPCDNLAKEIHNAKSKEKVHESSENQDGTHHDVKGKKKGKRALGSYQVNLDGNYHTAKEVGEETGEHNTNRSSKKKLRISWTPDLHHKFVQAISVLGENNIRPKEIQQMMNVPYLTCRHIASHLQKFKSQVRHLEDMCITDLPPASKSSNSSGGTKSSSSFESQSYPGNPTSTAFQNENQNQNQFPVNFAETKGLENFQQQETPGCANFSLQHPTQLINYGNQDLDAVVRGAVPDALMNKNQYLADYNISKFLGEDCDKDDCFRNGSNRDETAQNSGILKNSIFGNSSSSQKSDNCNRSYVSHFKAKPSAAVGEPEPDALMIESQTLTEQNNILRILGEDCEGYDCFGKGPDDITQNSGILKSSIYGNSFSSQHSDSGNASCVSRLKARPTAVVGGLESALTDQNQTLTEHNSILRFLEEGHDCFGKGPYAQNSDMPRNSSLGNNFGLQQSNDYNPTCVRLLKSKPDSLKDQNQTQTEYKNISKFLGEDCEGYDCFRKGIDIAHNSEILRSSISGNSFSPQQSDYCNPNSVKFLKAKPCAVVEGTMPDALMDHDKTLAEHNNVLRILGDDPDEYGCFGNEPSPDDIAMLKDSIFGDGSSP